MNAMTKLLNTVKRVERLEAQLHAEREQVRIDLRQVYASGVSQNEIARQLGISRTRVRQLLEDAPLT